jgi:Flp pilus assembly pilin Flp
MRFATWFERNPRARKLAHVAIRFVVDDGAQDLVEYALLAAFIATAGWVALNNIGPAVANTYSSWLDPTTGVPSLWDPADPLTSGS